MLSYPKCPDPSHLLMLAVKLYKLSLSLLVGELCEEYVEWPGNVDFGDC